MNKRLLLSIYVSLFLSFLLYSCVESDELVDENGVPPLGQLIANLDGETYQSFLSTAAVQLDSDTTISVTFAFVVYPNSTLVQSYMILMTKLIGSDERLGDYSLNPEQLTSNRGGIIFYRAPDSTVYLSTEGIFSILMADTLEANILQATFDGVLTASELTDEDIQPDTLVSPNSAFDFKEVTERIESDIQLKQDYIVKLNRLINQSETKLNTKSIKKTPVMQSMNLKNGGLNVLFFLGKNEYSYNEEKLN